MNWKPKIKFTVGLRNLIEFIYEKKIESIEFKKFSDKGGELIFIESKKIFKSGFKRFLLLKLTRKLQEVIIVIINVRKFYSVLMEKY